jgi:hypothetical protein
MAVVVAAAAQEALVVWVMAAWAIVADRFWLSLILTGLFFLVCLRSHGAESEFGKKAFWYHGKSNRIFLAPDVYYLSIRSDCEASNSKQWGALYGFDAGSIYQKPRSFYFSLTGHFAIGHLRGRDLFDVSTKSQFWEKWIEAHAGYQFLFGKEERVSLLVYSGYGYYAFDDKYKEMQSLLHTKAWYFPLGTLTTYLFNPRFSLGANLQWNLLTTGHWKLEGHPVFSDLHNSLKKTQGVLLELLFTFYFGIKASFFDLTLVPYFRKMRIDRRAHSFFPAQNMTLLAYGTRLEAGWLF